MKLFEFDGRRVTQTSKVNPPFKEYDIIGLKDKNGIDRPIAMIKDIIDVNGSRSARLELNVDDSTKQNYDYQKTGNTHFPKSDNVRTVKLNGLNHLIQMGQYSLYRMSPDALEQYKKDEENEIQNYDAQVNETLKIAGVNLSEGIETEEDTRTKVNAIASKYGLSTHDAINKYAEENGLNSDEVYDEYSYGKGPESEEEAEKELNDLDSYMHNQEYADDFYYTKGSYRYDDARRQYLKRVIKRLKEKKNGQQ